jgi:hypothetical protein
LFPILEGWEIMMAFRACPRKDDPFTKKVRETYGANVVAAPRAGIEPLTTVAKQDDRVEPRGHLQYLLEGEPPALPLVQSVPAAAMSGTRSSEVKASLGLDLSANFLSALGVPVPGAQLDVTLWKGASTLAFEVRDVMENVVDIAELAKAIDGHSIANNAATSIFLTDESQELLLVVRTLTTQTFAVRATRAGGQTVQVAVDGIAELLGSAQVGVSWKLEKDDWVSFHGSLPVTFGFAVVPCAIDPAGRLKFGLTRKDLTWAPSAQEGLIITPRPAIDGDSRAGLLVFD